MPWWTLYYVPASYMKYFPLYYYLSAFSWNELSTNIWLVNTYTRWLACSSSNSTDSNAMKSIRSGMSYLDSYLSFIFFLKSSFSLSVLIGGGLGKGVLFSASLSSSFRRACSLGAPVNIFDIKVFWTLSYFYQFTRPCYSVWAIASYRLMIIAVKVLAYDLSEFLLLP